MPKIDWTQLPVSVRQHLTDRMKERHISASDLHALMEWRSHAHEVPNGDWYKDFGTFYFCGRYEVPLTFLTKTQTPFGEEID